MNFGFSEEQDLLRDQVRRFLDDESPIPSVREVMETADGFDKSLWQQMSALGWTGLIIDEDYGGVSLSFVDLVVVLEEMGRSLFPSPFISNVLFSSTLGELGNEALKKSLLPRVASGDVIGTLALLDIPGNPIGRNITMTAASDGDGVRLSGSKPFVPDAGSADSFLVAFNGGDGRYLASIPSDAPGLGISGTATMDKTKRTGALSLDNVAVGADALMPLSDDALTRLVAKGAIATAAEMIGSAEAVLDMTTGYARERIQFDHPIGKYQGVKHRLAEMYVDIESLKSLTYFAAWTVTEEPASLTRAASLAKAWGSDAMARIGIDGVQLHGAIGFTAEYDVQLYLKRSKWARPAYGDATFHYDRVAALSLAESA